MVYTYTTRQAGLKHKVVVQHPDGTTHDVELAGTYWRRSRATNVAAALTAAFADGAIDMYESQKARVASMQQRIDSLLGLRKTDTIIPAHKPGDFLTPARRRTDASRSSRVEVAHESPSPALWAPQHVPATHYDSAPAPSRHEPAYACSDTGPSYSSDSGSSCGGD